MFPGLVAISSPYLSRLRGACCARPHGHCNAPLAFSISPGDPDGSWDGSSFSYQYSLLQIPDSLKGEPLSWLKVGQVAARL